MPNDIPREPITQAVRRQSADDQLAGLGAVVWRPHFTGHPLVEGRTCDYDRIRELVASDPEGLREATAPWLCQCCYGVLDVPEVFCLRCSAIARMMGMAGFGCGVRRIHLTSETGRGACGMYAALDPPGVDRHRACDLLCRRCVRRLTHAWETLGGWSAAA